MKLQPVGAEISAAVVNISCSATLEFLIMNNLGPTQANAAIEIIEYAGCMGSERRVIEGSTRG